MAIRIALSALRKKRDDMSQTALAKLSGVRQATISEIEHGKASMLRIDAIESLCRALKCEPNDLFVITPAIRTSPTSQRSKSE